MDDGISDYFGQFGEIIPSSMYREDTDLWYFVTFKTADAAINALENPH